MDKSIRTFCLETLVSRCENLGLKENDDDGMIADVQVTESETEPLSGDEGVVNDDESK